MQKNYRIVTESTDPSIELAIPQALYEDLCAFAEQHGCSLQSEILLRICESFQEKPKEEMTGEQWLDLIFSPLVASRFDSNS